MVYQTKLNCSYALYFELILKYVEAIMNMTTQVAKWITVKL